MHKRILMLLLSAVLILNLSACAETENNNDKDKLAVYYVNNGKYEESVAYIRSVDYYLERGEDAVNNALDFLGTSPENGDLASAFVKGTRIYSYELNDRVIDVTLSPAYLLLTELEKNSVKCCLALTLCGLKEIEYVNIYVDGKLIDGMLDDRMMIIEDTDTNEFEKRIYLYLPDENNYYLRSEERVLTVGQDVLLAEYVIEELIKYTGADGVRTAMPNNTKLLSVEVKNGVCTVDFSDEFVANRPVTAAEQRLTVYSVVNSLCDLENIDAVEFRIEGKKSNSGYEYIDISDKFTAFNDIVYYPREDSKLFATIYLRSDETDKMVRTPVIIDKDPEITTEENIVRYILSHSDISGYERLLPAAVQLLSIETINGICTIDLTETMLAGGAAKVDTIASSAIAAAVIDSGAVQQVNITVEGEEFLNNISQYADLIIE